MSVHNGARLYQLIGNNPQSPSLLDAVAETQFMQLNIVHNEHTVMVSDLFVVAAFLFIGFSFILDFLDT